MPELSDRHLKCLLKYPHGVQDLLADVVCRKKLFSTRIREFCKEYDRNPKQDLDGLADGLMGVALVSVPSSTLTEKQ